MKIVYRNARNFTGDDLTRAEAAMNTALAVFDNAEKTYNYSVRQGHASYARRVRKPEMDNAYEQYTRAKDEYDGILKSIQAANEADYAAAQQELVKKAMADQASGTPDKQDISTYIYIGIGLVVLLLIIKS